MKDKNKDVYYWQIALELAADSDHDSLRHSRSRRTAASGGPEPRRSTRVGP